MTRIIGMLHVVAVMVTLVTILCVLSLLGFEIRPKNDVRPLVQQRGNKGRLLWVTIGLVVLSVILNTLSAKPSH
jgi:multisubunit Na+/H+ antiporter MnhB subunit